MNVILPRAFMTSRRKATQKLKAASTDRSRREVPRYPAAHHCITLIQPIKQKCNSKVVARYLYCIFLAFIFTYQIFCPWLSASRPVAPHTPRDLHGIRQGR